MNCDPNSLLTAAAGLQGISPRQRAAIGASLCCQWAQKVTTFPAIANQTRLTVLSPTINGNTVIDLTNGPDLRSISFPNLVTINGDLQIQGFLDPLTFNISDPATIYFPLLQTVTGTLTIVAACARLDFPELATAGSLDLSNNSLLAEATFPKLASTVGNFHFDSTPLPHLDLPALASQIASFDGPVNCLTLNAPYVLPTGAASWEFQNSALDVAGVNLLLARCVANPAFGGVLDLSGANAAPTGQGLIDKATLLGRGCVVNTN